MTGHHSQNTFAPLVFSFDSSFDVRIVVIDDEPWFVAADVCAALGIANPSDAISKLDADEKSQVVDPTTLGLTEGTRINRLLNVVNESGLYTLILRCRDATKPGTPPHRFRKWVTKEVLPSIRKTGSYAQPHNASYSADCVHLTAAIQNLTEAMQSLTERLDCKAAEPKPRPAASKPAKLLPAIPFLDAWWVCLGSREVTASDLYQIITAQQCPTLLDAAEVLFGPAQNWTGRRLSNALRGWSQQQLEGFLLLNRGKGKNGIIWRLERSQ